MTTTSSMQASSVSPSFANPVVIDGSQGEGGGQILRSALALSAITGRPFVLEKIRAGRRKPGLMRQHLTCVRAAATMCGADVVGDELRSSDLRFTPGAIKSGRYHFAIGTAGSTSLVCQTVLPIALAYSRSDVADRAVDALVEVEIEGGTHVSFAPVTDFLTAVFLPVLRGLGADATLVRSRAGFNPAGGGKIVLKARPGAGFTAWKPLRLEALGDVVALEVVVLAGGTDGGPPEASSTAQKLQRALLVALGEHGVRVPVSLREEHSPNSPPGAWCLWVAMTTTTSTSLVSMIGERRGAAVDPVRRVVGEVMALVTTGSPVCAHLADQLLLPLALGAGGRFRTLPPTEHSRTNADIIRRFLPEVDIDFSEVEDGSCMVTVSVPKR